MRELTISAAIVSKLIFIFLVASILQSCVPTNKIIEENDIVYSNKKVTRFGYMLSDEIINKIKISNQVQFRYYSGPSMLTIKLNEKNLRKLKLLIDKT